MNLAICDKENGKVKKFIKNAMRKSKQISGDNGYIKFKPELFDLVWTEDDLTPIFEEQNKEIVFVGYKETKSDITPAKSPSIAREQPDHLPRSARIEMLERLEDIATMGFKDLDAYIENNITDLAKAKQFLKLHAKVTLATVKLVQDMLERI